MIRYRRIIQVVSLLFFMLMLALTVFPLRPPEGWVNIYVRMSPLHLMATALNIWKFLPAFIPAVVLVFLTLLLGRFFCGWVCPMGITLDATDRTLRPSRRGRDDSRELLHFKPVKYGILSATLVAAYFEANLAGWLDPQSIITRTYSQVVLPSFEFLADLILRGLYPIRFIRPATAALHSTLKTTLFALQQQSFHGMAATALIFFTIALLVYFNRRFWCRFLCPMGAILALVSRFSIFRRVVDVEKCISCNKCVKNCRMGAISDGGKRDYRGECIECFTCQDVCPVGAVSFRPAGRKTGAASLPVNFTRRTLMTSFGAGLLAVPVARLSRGASPASPIRPPGAGGERGADYFMQTCLRCGQCLRVCPTNGLQPSWFGGGLEGLWSPELTPRVGYCEFNCNLCGRVCPSGAIKKLTEAEKQSTRIGLAVFDKNLCIPWSRAENCLVCEEHCPVADKAIRFRTQPMESDDGKTVEIKLPYIVEDECIGCGICENKCPVKGLKGVRVTGLMPQEKKPARSVGAAGGIKGLLPGALAGVKAASPADLFKKDNLFDFIDGGAEIYYEYGYSAAGTREYGSGDNSFTVDIFKMTGEEAAFGIYSYERTPGARALEIGGGGYAAAGVVALWKYIYYVKINWYGSGDGGALTEKAVGEISALIGDSAPPPKILDILPGDAAKSEARLVLGPLAVNGFYPFGNGDPAGFKDGAKGVWYILPDGAKKIGLVYRDAEKEEAARGSLTKTLAGAEISSNAGNPPILWITIRQGGNVSGADGE